MELRFENELIPEPTLFAPTQPSLPLPQAWALGQMAHRLERLNLLAWFSLPRP